MTASFLPPTKPIGRPRTTNLREVFNAILHPAPLESGIVNDCAAVRMAIEHGFRSAFLCEHHGDDGLSVAAANRSYLRRPLPRTIA